eukprot:g369.t1
MPSPGAHDTGAVRLTAPELLARAKDASHALGQPFPAGARIARYRERVVPCRRAANWRLLARAGSAAALAEAPALADWPLKLAPGVAVPPTAVVAAFELKCNGFSAWCRTGCCARALPQCFQSPCYGQPTCCACVDGATHKRRRFESNAAVRAHRVEVARTFASSCSAGGCGAGSGGAGTAAAAGAGTAAAEGRRWLKRGLGLCGQREVWYAAAAAPGMFHRAQAAHVHAPTAVAPNFWRAPSKAKPGQAAHVRRDHVHSTVARAQADVARIFGDAAPEEKIARWQNAERVRRLIGGRNKGDTPWRELERYMWANAKLFPFYLRGDGVPASVAPAGGGSGGEDGGADPNAGCEADRVTPHIALLASPAMRGSCREFGASARRLPPPRSYTCRSSRGGRNASMPIPPLYDALSITDASCLKYPSNSSASDESSASGNAGVGALIAVLASVLSNVGVNVQKHAHLINSGRPEEQRVPYTRMPVWWFGMAGVVGGSLGDFAALSFATQALVAALGGATTLTTNLFIARFWHKEALSRLDFAGVASIIIGAVIIAAKTPNTDSYTLADMSICAEQTEFIVYLVVLGLVLIILLSFIANSKFYVWKKRVIASLLRPMTRQLERMSEAEGFLFQRVLALERDNSELRAALQVELGAYRARTEKRAGADTDAGTDAGSDADTDAGTGTGTDAGADAGSQPPSPLPMPGGEEGGTAPTPAAAPPQAGEYARFASRHGMRRARRLRGAPERRLVRYWDALQNPDEQQEQTRYRRWSDAFIYAACAGVIGSLSVLFAGLVAKSLLQALTHEKSSTTNPFSHATPYVFLLGMVLCIVWQTAYLNRALAMADVTTVYPVFQGFWIGFGVVGGIVFYEQGHIIFCDDSLWEHGWCAGATNGENIALYLFSAVCILGGCALLAAHGRRNFMRGRSQTAVEEQDLNSMREELPLEGGKEGAGPGEADTSETLTEPLLLVKA